ncbi:RNA polymerase sigma factor [Planomonospora alba]|uniref:RNA polymerase sigma factor n=1 Tax=Planomonospora alba TaxID=161354 RepID=UPI003CD0718F
MISWCRTRDPRLAEDLAQEAFVKATRAMLGRRGESPTPWLLTIARNVLVGHLRRSRTGLPLPSPEERGAPESATDAVAVPDVLDRLPEQRRRLLVLVYFEGFSPVEVAAMTGRSTAPVETAGDRGPAGHDGPGGRHRLRPAEAVAAVRHGGGPGRYRAVRTVPLRRRPRAARSGRCGLRRRGVSGTSSGSPRGPHRGMPWRGPGCRGGVRRGLSARRRPGRSGPSRSW